MSKQQRNILLALGQSEEYRPLTQALHERGYHIIEAITAAEIRVQCRQYNVELIITTVPADQSSDYLSSRRYPEHTPIIVLATGGHARIDFPGITAIAHPPYDTAAFHHLVASFIKVSDLHRERQEQKDELTRLYRQLAQQQQSMQQHHDFLDVLASRDGLTGLYNRRHLGKVLDKEFKRSEDVDTDLCLAMFDLDYFEKLNRNAGRAFGDYVLNDFAARLTHATQPNGVCFRFSGEVFVVLLSDTTLNDALDCAESIRRQLPDRPFVMGDDRHTLTVSAAVASLISHRPADPDEFITMAERALFTAKAEGRNRVVEYRPFDTHQINTSQQSVILLKETLNKILDKTRQSAIDSLQLLARDAIGDDSRPHIQAVRYYVDLLGTHLGLPKPLVETFKNAITLHTCIRLLLHSEMIRQKKLLSDDERVTLKDFPFKLAELTELFDFFANERNILLYHAERYDGSGYPEGLKGDDIPLGARLFTLTDALAAMSADRPYRDRLTPDEILAELTHGAGKQFDPNLVISLLELMQQQRILEIEAGKIEAAVQSLRHSYGQEST